MITVEEFQGEERVISYQNCLSRLVFESQYDRDKVMCKEKVAVPEGAKPIYPNFCKGASRCARLTTGPLLRRFKNISVEETADYNDWSLTNLG